MKKGFSLIELLISLIVISCITAAFTPIITKKFSSGVFGGSSGSNGWSDECKDISADCKLCFKGECVMCNLECLTDGEYKDTPSCKCLPCTDKFGSNCTKCESDKCESCLDGSYLDNGNCMDCKSKFEHCTKCDKNECKTCETNYKLDNGKCVPDCTKFFNANCTSCDETKCMTCKPNYDLVGNDCIANCTKIFGASCTSCSASACTACASGYAVKNGTCKNCSSLFSNCTACTATACSACSGNYILSNGSCTTCSAKFGSSCTSCTASACTACANGYHLSGSTCVVDFTCSGSDFVQIGSLCVTRKNMGDSTSLPIPSKVNLVSTGTTCSPNSTNFCCWRGATSQRNCNNTNNWKYSGCNRTVCDWYAADYICKNFTAGGKTWRLPTSSDMYEGDWANNHIYTLYICDQGGYSEYTVCGSSEKCKGSYKNECSPFRIWTSSLQFSGAYAFYLHIGSFDPIYPNLNSALSVRCVTEL